MVLSQRQHKSGSINGTDKKYIFENLMKPPEFSVIMPAYNGADYIDKSIKSVLDQTYTNFEIIVIDDASKDITAEVVQRFNDSRIKFIRHEVNRGSNAARNSGIRASSGRLIAYLDQDDLFHPEKLQYHKTFYDMNPSIGASYNSRFELNCSSNTIRELWRPPLQLSLSDLLIGFPISPTDTVHTRDWVIKTGLWDENIWFNGGEMDLYCRLVLAGCSFAGIDRALNYRRRYTNRIISNLSEKCDAEIEVQKNIFADPRCPEEVKKFKSIAFSQSYLSWSNYAFEQKETSLGQSYLREAIRLTPDLLEGKPAKLFHFLIRNTITDESKDHSKILKSIIDQLPVEISWLADWYKWGVARGYLYQGTRAIIWGRQEDGKSHFSQAVNMKAEIDESFLRQLTHQLLGYNIEFGSEATFKVMNQLIPHIKEVGGRSNTRSLKGFYAINKAFQNYHLGNFKETIQNTVQAILYNPTYLSNRGVLSILSHSLIGSVKNKGIP